MSENTASVAQLAGHWVVPVIESNSDGVLRLHVSIAVGQAGDLADAGIGVSVTAGGQTLSSLEVSSVYYLQTLATTAVADFSFSNPDNAAVDSVTVTLQDQSLTWNLGSGSLPVA